MGGMASAAADDFSVGIGLKPATPGHRLRTAKTIKRNMDEAAYYGSNNDNSGVAQSLAESNRNLAARQSAMSIAPVAAAPTVPDPDAIGETEQALLDAQKKGRSSTIATSAKGLLAGEDDTSKKRSLMGSLIT